MLEILDAFVECKNHFCGRVISFAPNEREKPLQWAEQSSATLTNRMTQVQQNDLDRLMPYGEI